MGTCPLCEPLRLGVSLLPGSLGPSVPSQDPLPPFSRVLYSASAPGLHFTSPTVFPSPPPLHPLLCHLCTQMEGRAREHGAGQLAGCLSLLRAPTCPGHTVPCTLAPRSGAGPQAEPNGGMQQQRPEGAGCSPDPAWRALPALLEALLETVTRGDWDTV